MKVRLFQFFFILCFGLVFSIKEDDLVTNLPGLIFKTNFKMYSGYLNGNDEGSLKMFYWLVESKNDPVNSPLLVWFNGGPSCSSMEGSFTELGPLYNNQDGRTLYENIYSWNHKANVIFLESPAGVGFSYDTKLQGWDYKNQTDENTWTQNYIAISDFFQRVQPQYANRSFYLTGESYAGHYTPELAVQVLNGIENKTFPNSNFKGFSIGNPELSYKWRIRAQILWAYYHGIISIEDWTWIKKNCKGSDPTVSDPDDYDFPHYFVPMNGIDYASDGSQCGNLLQQWVGGGLNTSGTSQDGYNFYQDCYTTDGKLDTVSTATKPDYIEVTRNHKRVRRNALMPNTADSINYRSTDNQFGFTCWSGDAMSAWVNQPAVLKALHIDQVWINKTRKDGHPNYWKGCSWDTVYPFYKNTHVDMKPFFKQIFESTTKLNIPFKILIYNGDVDTSCNFLQDGLFMHELATENGFNGTTRQYWYYRNQTAGFAQNWSKGQISIDVLTVKGSGHFVPNDRPGPALQMIDNFIYSSAPVNYSSPVIKDIPDRQPLISQPKPKDNDKSSGVHLTLFCYISTLLALLYLV